MKVNWIAFVIAIPFSYLVAAMQFFPTRAVPKRLGKFFAGDHYHATNSDSHRRDV
jgi:hypothetical protein